MGNGLIEEYSGIRSEIVSLETLRDQLIATIFSISISLLGLGYTLNKGILFVILIVVVIPFQSLINKKTFMIVKCGVYIKVFIEPKFPEMRWEQVIHNADDDFSKKYLTLDKYQITKNMYKYGSLIFSVIALVSYCYQEIEISANNISISIGEFIIIFILIICVFITFYLCYKNSNYNKMYNIYEEILTSYNK